jgi:hypothetical protein
MVYASAPKLDVVLLLGNYFSCHINQPLKNEKLFESTSCDTIVIQMANQGKVEKKNKYVQFVAIWHLLQQGYSMTNFESFKVLFQFLKLENYLQKHWFDTTRWTMEEVMHKMFYKPSKNVCKK